MFLSRNVRNNIQFESPWINRIFCIGKGWTVGTYRVAFVLMYATLLVFEVLQLNNRVACVQQSPTTAGPTIAPPLPSTPSPFSAMDSNLVRGPLTSDLSTVFKPSPPAFICFCCKQARACVIVGVCACTCASACAWHQLGLSWAGLPAATNPLLTR